jgi:protein phosphatase-4 regulatory subunit 3
MDGLASHHQSLLHVKQHLAASISENVTAASSSASTDSNSSLSDSPPHPGQNSSLNNDPGMSSVAISFPPRQTQQTNPETIIGLTPLAEERSAGSTLNADQPVTLVDNIPTKDEGEVLLQHVNGQIELLEGSPDIGIGSQDSGLIVEENQEWVPDADNELKRVKVSCYISSSLKLSMRWPDQHRPTLPRCAATPCPEC